MLRTIEKGKTLSRYDRGVKEVTQRHNSESIAKYEFSLTRLYQLVYFKKRYYVVECHSDDNDIVLYSSEEYPAASDLCNQLNERVGVYYSGVS